MQPGALRALEFDRIVEAVTGFALTPMDNLTFTSDFYYIVPEKCTECVGFFDQEQCAAVCPVDCCVPNPDDPESEEQLIAKAQRIHPDRTFEPGFPSRFRKI